MRKENNKITTKTRFVTAFVTILLLFGFVAMFNAFNINLLARQWYKIMHLNQVEFFAKYLFVLN